MPGAEERGHLSALAWWILPALVAAEVAVQLVPIKAELVAQADAEVARNMQRLGLAPRWSPAAFYGPGSGGVLARPTGSYSTTPRACRVP